MSFYSNLRQALSELTREELEDYAAIRDLEFISICPWLQGNREMAIPVDLLGDCTQETLSRLGRVTERVVDRTCELETSRN